VTDVAAPTDDKRTQAAVDALLQATPAGSRVIVFGSRARGDDDASSDLDLLVVEPEVSNPVEEAARLLRILEPLKIPADVLVASESTFRYWSDTPNTVHHAARTEGEVHEQVA